MRYPPLHNSALVGELAVHQRRVPVRVRLGNPRLEEIIDAHGHLLAISDERRA